MSDSRTSAMSRCASAVLSAALGLSSAMIAVAANDIWDANGAIPPNGIWGTGANWVDNTTPGNFDTATFNAAQSYAVTFNAAPAAIRDLTVSAGIPTFVSSSGGNTLNVTSASGGQDVSINGGSSLSLGASGNPLHLNVGDDLTVNGGGTLNINFGSQVSTTDLFLAQGSNGEINISGAGSALTQSGGAGITVGAASGTTGTIRLAATGNGGTLTTGTGPFTIDPTGTVNIGFGSNFGGTLYANGDVIVNGGTLTKELSGALIQASGKTITVQNGGTYSAATIDLGVLGDTLLVDGISSSASANYFAPSSWGSAGHGAAVTFSNNAFGSFVPGGIELGGDNTSTLTIVQVNSGADLISGDLKLAHNNSATVLFTVDGEGSSVTLPPSATLTVGGSFSGLARINVHNGGSLFVGNGGSTTLNLRGQISIDGGTVDLGTLIQNGGRIDTFTAGSLRYIGDLSVESGGLLGANLSLYNNHDLTLSGTTVIATGGALSLDGGTLNTGQLSNFGGTFAFFSGTLGITGTAGLHVDALFASNTTLQSPHTVNVFETTWLSNHTLTLDGGTFNTGAIVDQSTTSQAFSFKRGTLGITGIDGLRFGSFVYSPFYNNSLTLTAEHTLNVSYTTNIYSQSLTIDGGTFNTGWLTRHGGSFEFLRGTLGITGPSGLLIGFLGGPIPGDFTLDSQRTLNVANTTTITSPRRLTLDGGVFNTGALVVQGTFAFESGTLGITGPAGLTIGAAGPMGSALSLNSNQALHITYGTTIDNGSQLVLESGSAFSTSTLTNNGELALGGLAAVAEGIVFNNNGLIRGEGRITAVVTNNAAGEIRAENGKRVKLQSTNGLNAGQINLQGGTAEFSQSLTNAETGRIQGRGTLMVDSAGLVNQGNVALASGITDVFGDVTNNTGNASRGISIAGNATVNFWDDVINTSGLFKVNAGSSVTFFGTFSGNGITGNAADIHFEGNVSPGASPAAVAFGGNVSLGGAASFLIELGGLNQGSQYDHVDVADDLLLDGGLQVALLGSFMPGMGSSFDILDWGNLIGTFSSLDLPSLGGSLAWDTSQLYTSGVLSVVSSHSTGDYNLDGNVNAADYVVWRKLDSGNPPSYTDWRKNFGEGMGAGGGSVASANATVPEPATLVMVIVAAGGIRLRRRGIA